MYGAGHVWEGHANFYLHDHDLARAPPTCLTHVHHIAPAQVQSFELGLTTMPLLANAGEKRADCQSWSSHDHPQEHVQSTT